MKKPKFVRTDFRKYSKLGVRRKKKQVYRKSKGRDNKIRLNMKGHTKNISIGFRTEKKKRDLIKNLHPIMIHNLADLEKIKEKNIGIIAKIGAKKRKEILEQVIKENIKLSIDSKKALEKIEKNLEKAKERKEKLQNKKIARDKKAQKEAEKKAKKEAKEEAKENKADEKPEDISQKGIEKKQEEIKQIDNSAKKEIKSNNYGRGN